MQPLNGYKVLDFTTLLPGPLASLVLAESGAEVIKIERPTTGDDMRHYPPMWGKNSVNFAMFNRGKKSLSIDIKDKRQRKKLIPLIEQSDILIEQFRPGVMQRVGLDYETLKSINPKLIYCSITGYGQTGPKSQQAGHDLNYIGDTGLLNNSTGMNTGGQPNIQNSATLPPTLIADIAGGTYPALVNILMALIAREKTGKGCYLDIAMSDNMFMLMGFAMGEGLATNKWPKDGDALLTGGSPRYQLCQTSDGKLLAIAALEQKFWQNFCALIDLPRDMIDHKFDPKQVISKIQSIIIQQTAKHWEELFKGHDCCCTIVNTLQEAMQEQHFQSRGLFQASLTNENGDYIPALPTCLAPYFRDSLSPAKSAPLLNDN